MKTKTLIEKLVSLPTEERILLVDSLLKSLNQTESKIDKEWAIQAQKRLTEIRTKDVKAVSGKEVFRKLWDRFEE